MKRKSPFPALLREAVDFIVPDHTGSEKYVSVVADAIENGFSIEVSSVKLAIEICFDHLRHSLPDPERDARRFDVLINLSIAADGVIEGMPQYAVV